MDFRVRAMQKIKIREFQDGILGVISPYNKDFSEAMKELHARWKPDEKLWTFQADKRAEVEAAIARCYGTEDSVTAGTVIDAVNSIIEDRQALYSGDTIERIIAFAYYYGREQATKEVSDAYRSLIRDMRKRADKSRYTALINEAIGDKNYLLFGDYPGRITKEIGKLKTDVLKEQENV